MVSTCTSSALYLDGGDVLLDDVGGGGAGVQQAPPQRRAVSQSGLRLPLSGCDYSRRPKTTPRFLS